MGHREKAEETLKDVLMSSGHRAVVHAVLALVDVLEDIQVLALTIEEAEEE